MIRYTLFRQTVSPFMWEHLTVFCNELCLHNTFTHYESLVCFQSRKYFIQQVPYSLLWDINHFRNHPLCFLHEPQFQPCTTCSDISKMYGQHRLSSQILQVKSTWKCGKESEMNREKVCLWNIYENWNGRNHSQRTNISVVILRLKKSTITGIHEGPSQLWNTKHQNVKSTSALMLVDPSSVQAKKTKIRGTSSRHAHLNFIFSMACLS